MEKRYFAKAIVVFCLICASLELKDISYNCPAPTGTIISGKRLSKLRLYKNFI